MDGLLLNTEDIYTLCADNVLLKYGRPRLPWSVKAQLMGVPGSNNGDTFHNWAQLPISRELFEKERKEQELLHFPECEILPGAQKLLLHLNKAHNTNGMKIQIALASSSEKYQYDLKATKLENKEFLDLIREEYRVLGDDPRVQHGRGKPAPDIYLLALQTINSKLPVGISEIVPEECLVFEDSVPGVEAGRRAGMRVVWVPHPGLFAQWGEREKAVLAGRTGLIEIGNEEQLGEVDDGFGEYFSTLEDFPYAKYGIEVPV
ncbi:HAD-like protein [Hyaloscypha hepaticicola]|uniref:HAD-like protein n=1 Tax=Hyaloscypha hepaticicola TaxID=2082293 RepID=A0A2J6PHU8_9HELO|nr:HAD-like protein [Hyaloscypha hepaticicola]